MNIKKVKPTWPTDGETAFMISDDEIIESLSSISNDNFRFSGVYSLASGDPLDIDIHPGVTTGGVFHVDDEDYQHWIAFLIRGNKYIHFDSDANIDIIEDYVYPIVKGNFLTLTVNLTDIQMDNVNCGYFVLDFIHTVGINPDPIQGYKSFMDKYDDLTALSVRDNREFVMELRRKYFSMAK